ncbi:MAG: D-lyxose/D-mannose family sugar isomerase [Hydrogeniiclostridium sp.]
MLTEEQIKAARERTLEYFQKAGIVLTEEEKGRIEIADMGLGQLEVFGLQLITYVSTQRCSAKELVLFPGQTCPEHIHPPIDGEPGKEETFRCRMGTVYLYVDGEPTPNPVCTVPEEKRRWFGAAHEIILRPGEQYTLFPGTRHWFQAGPEGCIVSEFSTRNVDEKDIFTDPEIVRC